MPDPIDDENIDSSPSGEESSEVSEQGTEEDKSQSGKLSAEDRINELVGKTKELEEKLKTYGESKETPMPTDSQKVTPQVKQAIDSLKKMGKFVSEDELNEKFKQIEDRMLLDSSHNRLEQKFDGSDGRPKYNRSEVENYMRDKGIFGDPEIAYDQMYRTELLQYEIKQAEAKRKEKPYVAKEGESVAERGDNTITREKIADAMKTPEGRVWYEKNRDKILSLMQQGQLA